MKHDQVETFLSTKTELDKAVAEFLPVLKDKSSALDERWNWFTVLSKAKLLGTELYGDGFIDVLAPGLCLVDDFYIDRHETRLYADLYDQICDTIAEGDSPYTAKNTDDWREVVLAAGKGSFRNDW